MAAAAALRLSPQPFDFACELSRSSSAELVQMGLGFGLFSQHSDEVRICFKGLLEDERVRKSSESSSVFSKRMNHEEMENFLIVITAEVLITTMLSHG